MIRLISHFCVAIAAFLLLGSCNPEASAAATEQVQPVSGPDTAVDPKSERKHSVWAGDRYVKDDRVSSQGFTDSDAQRFLKTFHIELVNDSISFRFCREEARYYKWATNSFYRGDESVFAILAPDADSLSIISTYENDQNTCFPLDNLALFVKSDEEIVVYEKGYFFYFVEQLADTPTTYKKWPDSNDLPETGETYYNNEYIVSEPLPRAGYLVDISMFYDAFLSPYPDHNGFKVAILDGCYELGNCEQYLITLDENFRELHRLTLSFNTAPDGNEATYTFADFSIDEDYNIEVTTVDVVENLDTQQEISRESTVNIYTIDASGKFTERR